MKKIWLSSPHMGGIEHEFVQEAFDGNWIAPIGPNLNEFERELSNFTGAKYSVGLTSGTAAIHLALILLDVKKDDVVICSSFTFSASVNPIIYQKAKPVFVDSETETWNMDPLLLEKAIKECIKKGKKPKAIILVHLYGYPAKLNEIMEISNRYYIPIIEDAAEAVGSKYNDQPLGTFGELGIFSFNGNKIITTNTLKKSCIVDAAKALLNSPSLLTWPKETRVFVTVVPIFAPMTIGIAYSRLRTPLPTNPTIVDVVTDED